MTASLRAICNCTLSFEYTECGESTKERRGYCKTARLLLSHLSNMDPRRLLAEKVSRKAAVNAVLVTNSQKVRTCIPSKYTRYTVAFQALALGNLGVAGWPLEVDTVSVIK